MPRKLLLINPANKVRKGFTNDPSTSFSPLGLGIVAALTPPHWEVELIDESFGEFAFKQADLVALTGFTANAPRAYEIAAVYRKAGIHTVMGGIHASMWTHEVAEYVDTVFTGEAEGAWPELISDFEAGIIKKKCQTGKIYEAEFCSECEMF
ncbi:MAG: cobalamin-dependent protein, partial [Bacteroidales bacterium]|nr:cobalamin-dependent protein [Bacteroidales bacterium]